MYSIILAFRVLEAKIGHPGPIASPAAEDGSGWRRCGTGWRRLRGCDASQRAGFGHAVRGPNGSPEDRHRGGMLAGCPGFRAVPGVPPGQMVSASAAKIPQSHRAGAHRAAGGFAADLPRRAGTGRGFRGGGRAYRRQKSAPGRVPRWRQTSEPGYHPHRLRHGTENPSKRRPCLSFHAMRSLYPTFTPQPTSEVYTPRRGVPLRIHRSRKTSDLPPGIEPPSFHPY